MQACARGGRGGTRRCCGMWAPCPTGSQDHQKMPGILYSMRCSKHGFTMRLMDPCTFIAGARRRVGKPVSCPAGSSDLVGCTFSFSVAAAYGRRFHQVRAAADRAMLSHQAENENACVARLCKMPGIFSRRRLTLAAGASSETSPVARSAGFQGGLSPDASHCQHRRASGSSGPPGSCSACPGARPG